MITDFRIWCDNQTVDMNGKVRCLAHFVEGRVLFCPYSDNADRLRSKPSFQLSGSCRLCGLLQILPCNYAKGRQRGR